MPHKTLSAIFTIALLLATAAATGLQAQQEEGGRRRGGGGFPGGFGGGFNRGGGPLALLRINEVRQELKVTEDQQELIDILNDEVRESRPEFGNFREMSEAERAEWSAKFEKWNTEQTAQARETLKTILDEGQYKRLEQIHVQTQGVNALVDEQVAKTLKLTPEQVTKLKETQEANREATRAAMREAFQGGRDSADRAAMREKMETLRKESEAKMLAHLTPEQQAEFTELKGEPFAMPAPDFGGRGRGGRGGPESRGGDRPERPERPE